MTIRLHFRSVDGYAKTRTYKTLKGAQKEAHRMLGAHPDLGSFYAISFDGVCRLTVDGCKLADLFPEPVSEGQAQGICDPEGEHARHECGQCYIGFAHLAGYRAHMRAHPAEWKAWVRWLGAEPTTDAHCAALTDAAMRRDNEEANEWQDSQEIPF